MAQLPIFQSGSKEMGLMQTAWSSLINPFLSRPQLQSNILPSVSLINGVNTINHLLGRKLQGWQIVDINGAASIYRSQPKNDLTLTLTSNAAVTVDLLVF